MFAKYFLLYVLMPKYDQLSPHKSRVKMFRIDCHLFRVKIFFITFISDCERIGANH